MSMEPECSHEWAIYAVKAGVSWGKCKKCPATRGFPSQPGSGQKNALPVNLGGRGSGGPENAVDETEAPAAVEVQGHAEQLPETNAPAAVDVQGHAEQLPETDRPVTDEGGPPETEVPRGVRWEVSRYYDAHRDEILAEIAAIGPTATSDKWGIPRSSLRYLRYRWSTPPSRVADPEKKAMVERLLDHPGLPDRERQVLRLRYIEGKGRAELAKAVGVSAEWTRMIEQKGLKILRDVDARERGEYEPQEQGLDERVKLKSVRDMCIFLAGYRLAVKEMGGKRCEQEYADI